MKNIKKEQFKPWMAYIVGFVFALVLFFAQWAAHVKAETLPGYDVLAVAKYCKTYLNAPQLPAVSTLLNTFGDPLPCIEQSVRKGGLKHVQIDLIDATCWRNNVCPKGAPRPDDLKTIESRAKLVQALADRYPHIDWWVSPALEHDVKNVVTVQKMIDAAKRGCPRCRVMNSPFSGAVPPGTPVEKHGTKTSAFSVSGDGASSYDGDNLKSDGNNFEHRTSGSYTTFAWWNELNLRCTGEKKFTPPLSRTERPTADQFKQAYMIMQPEPPVPAPPAQCKKITRVNAKAGEILKTNAESYCNGTPNDSRANKPLLILRKQCSRGQKLNLLSSSGKVVGCYSCWGPYSTPGLYRWYLGNCSGQYPAQLAEQLGGEWGFLAMGGGQCLLVNAVRRMGVYR